MSSYQFAPMTPVVKRLMIVIALLWFGVQVILENFLKLNVSTWFILHPDQVIEKFYAWQLVTYGFFHSWKNIFHVVFNLLMLWFIGSELERHWGGRFFFLYYMACGIGAGLIYCLGVGTYSAITGAQGPLIVPVLGASGSLFGLLVAYGIVFSERVIYFFGLFPIKAKYFAMITAGMEFYSLMTTGVAGGEVAYLAHLGGALVGFLYLWFSAYFKRTQKTRKKNVSLRLVVDNEKLKKDDNPKYWN